MRNVELGEHRGGKGKGREQYFWDGGGGLKAQGGGFVDKHLSVDGDELCVGAYGVQPSAFDARIDLFLADGRQDTRSTYCSDNEPVTTSTRAGPLESFHNRTKG